MWPRNFGGPRNQAEPIERLQNRSLRSRLSVSTFMFPSRDHTSGLRSLSYFREVRSPESRVTSKVLAD